MLLHRSSIIALARAPIKSDSTEEDQKSFSTTECESGERLALSASDHLAIVPEIEERVDKCRQIGNRLPRDLIKEWVLVLGIIIESPGPQIGLSHDVVTGHVVETKHLKQFTRFFE